MVEVIAGMAIGAGAVLLLVVLLRSDLARLLADVEHPDVEHPDDESTVERWRRPNEVADDVMRWRAVVDAKADLEQLNMEIARRHVDGWSGSAGFEALLDRRPEALRRIRVAEGMIDDAVVEELRTVNLVGGPYCDPEHELICIEGEPLPPPAEMQLPMLEVDGVVRRRARYVLRTRIGWVYNFEGYVRAD